MNTTDFTKGVDLTGINPATAADINNLVDLAVPEKDTAEDVGKGLNLITTDSALDTPSVPNASVTVKWKRYQWIRRSFDGSVQPKAYLWDDNKANDATLLKWYEISADLTSLQTDIDSAIATATNAETVAGAVATTAATALTTANTALTTANGAVTTANTANTNATTANATANTASANATLALAQRDVSVVLTPGTALQKIRTNAAGAAVEWFSEVNDYALVVERRASGTDATTPASAGAIALTTIETDTGGLISLGANKITFTLAGTYLIKARVPIFGTGNGGGGELLKAQAYISNDVSALRAHALGTAISVTNDTGTIQRCHGFSEVMAVITVAAAEGIYLRVVFQTTNITLSTGKATGLTATNSITHPDTTAFEFEYYSSVEIWRIG